jgi:hypothetical protein
MLRTTTIARRTADLNRPMLVYIAVILVAAVVSAVGMVVDHRLLFGAPIWAKPFKFAVSTALYSVMWVWLMSMVQRGRRLAMWVTNIVVALLALEYSLIVMQVVRGQASHFNMTTPFDSVVYQVMGDAIFTLYAGTMLLTVLLMRTKIEDTAKKWALYLGALLSLVGIGLAVLMVGPTEGQLAQPTGYLGAHTVGVADDGPGMPITGWSTTGGDLRIPHFVGLHALQALPLFLLGLNMLAKRFARLRPMAVRTRLVVTAAIGYAGLIALVTWQAERGQSLVHPDRATLTALALLVAAFLLGVLVSVYRPVAQVKTRELVDVR